MPLDRLLTGHGDADHRSRRARRASASADHERRCERILDGARGRPRHRVRDRPAAVVAAHGAPSSPCWSSGRCSATSTCCSTRARHASRSPTTARAYGLAAFALAAAPPRCDPPSGLPLPRPSQPRTPRRWPPCTNQPTRSPTLLTTCATCSTCPAAWRSSPAAPAGLGLAMARGFAQAGAEVVVVSRKADACDEVVAALRAEGAKAAACACHVGHWEALDGLVEDVYRDFGRVDVLVNNAGVSPLYERAHRRHRGALRQGHRRQPEGPVPARRARRRADGRGRRRIDHQRQLEHGRGAARRSDIVPYAAAKAGVNAMTVGLAHAFGPSVRVNAIMPGPFLTTIAQAWDMDLFAERARTFPLRRAGEARGDRRRRALPRERRVELHHRHDPHRRRRRPVEHGGHRRQRPDLKSAQIAR